MKNTFTKVLLTIFGGGIALAAPIVPTEVQVQGSFNTKQKAELHRQYLQERSDYYEQINLEQKHKDQAAYAKNNWEEKLLEDGFTDVRGGEIKEKPTRRQSVFETIISFDWVSRAYAYTFGKEDFESCGSIPCSFDLNESSGTGNFALDNTSKINGADTARCDIAAPGDICILSENLTADDTYYIQFYILLPTGFTFGASGYLGLFATGNGTNAPVYCNLEDYGTARITCQGELGIPYIDTGIDIPINTPTKVEFRVKANATTGDLDIWKNNDVEGSPDFNGTGLYNTGSANLVYFNIGGFHPDTVNDKFYDDVIVHPSFIGAGIPDSYIKSTLRGGLNVKGGGTIK